MDLRVGVPGRLFGQAESFYETERSRPRHTSCWKLPAIPHFPRDSGLAIDPCIARRPASDPRLEPPSPRRSERVDGAGRRDAPVCLAQERTVCSYKVNLQDKRVLSPVACLDDRT
jgi:hypothetical protein